MAERFRQVHPDEILTLRDGREVAVVSEELFVNEVAKIASFIAFAGGTMSAVVYRQPTDLRGEMVTVGAVLSWADRTDARPQPEVASAPAARPDERDYDEAMREFDRPTPEQVLSESPDRDGGSGAGALPFQPAAPLPRTEPPPYEPPQPTPMERARVAAANAEAEIEADAAMAAHVQRESSRAAAEFVTGRMTDEGIEPALPSPAHDDDVDDGLSGVGGEDLSEIPEHMR
jgi:hypothetical protein